MRKLSLKWKLFLVFSYIELLFWTAMLALSANAFFRNARAPKDVFPMILYFAFLIIIVLSTFLNIYTIHRHYPDIPLPSKMRRVKLVLTVGRIIAWMILLIILIMETNSLSKEPGSFSSLDLSVTILISSMWLLGVYNLILE